MPDAKDLPYVQVATEQMARAEALQAELERLRGDVAFMQSEVRAWHERYDKAWAEVQRLRERVAELDAAVGQAWREP